MNFAQFSVSLIKTTGTAQYHVRCTTKYLRNVNLKWVQLSQVCRILKCLSPRKGETMPVTVTF